MDITRKYLDGLVKDFNKSIVEIKDRKFSKYGDKDDYIVLEYAALICNRLKRQLKENQYVPSTEIITLLKGFNWDRYSFASKAYSGNDLDRVLLATKREAKDRVNLLEKQAEYLKRGAKLIICVIEED